MKKNYQYSAYLICSLFFWLPLSGQAAITLDISDGGGSVVNFNFSGQGTISPGFSVSNTTSTRIRLPEDGSWSSFFSNGDFDNTGSALLNVTNVTSGIFTVTGDPSVFIDGSEVALSGGTTVGDGSWQVEFFNDPSFRFRQSDGADSLQYPALTGGEIISMTGSGSFDLGAGDFATNFNIGNYNLAGDSGIDFQINVGSPVPVPAAWFLFATGLVGLGGLRKRLSW